MKTFVIGFAILSPMLASACAEIFEGGRYGMMGYGGGMSFFMVAGGIVWTVVGILAGVWLWRELNKKNGGH